MKGYSPNPGYDWNPLRAHRNIPCPCESGKKAKHCHGRDNTIPASQVKTLRTYLKAIEQMRAKK